MPYSTKKMKRKKRAPILSKKSMKIKNAQM